MPHTPASVVGVDIAKATFDTACPLDNGRYRTRAKLPNTPAGFTQYAQWLSKHAAPDAWVVMEATGVYHEALATDLHARGYRVCVVNPYQIKAYAQSELSRTKTDRTDAKLIARFAQGHVQTLRAWVPDTPAQRTVRELVRRLEDLKRMRQMECNRLELAHPAVQGSLHTLIATFNAQIKATERAIAEHIDNDPDLRQRCKRLCTIDGIGTTTAHLILAELGDLQRFDDAKAVVAFTGLNPALRQSGKYQGQVHISKIGCAALRKGLYMPAVVALSKNAPIRAQAARLRARGKPGKVIVCAAMRKLLHIIYGVLRSGTDFNPTTALA